MSVVTLTDADTGATAQIAPDRGFNCFSFKVRVGSRWVEVLDTLPGFLEGTQKPSRSGIPILFPFPNRIRGGRFTWQGQAYQLPATDTKGNAIHGFCLDRAWRVVAQGPQFVTAQFRLSVDAPDRLALWPADFLLEVDYELLHNRLRANFRILNVSRVELPWGLGTHAYFRLPVLADGRPSDCTVEVPASHVWELQDNLPSGRIVPVADDRDLRDGAYLEGLALDDVLTNIDCPGPQYDLVMIDERAGVQITQQCPPIFREVVAFTPPQRSAVCLEPYTCVTDAINLESQGIDAGWRTLGTGSEFHTWIDISAGPILA
jgi:aldose 1-epimerase